MEIPRHWRLKAQRYRLEGSICPICGQPVFPPRPICPFCSNQPMWIADHRLLEIPKAYRIRNSISLKGDVYEPQSCLIDHQSC
jgi:Rubredoxin-like zinc ribbon domain (DUF35_N)